MDVTSQINQQAQNLISAGNELVAADDRSCAVQLTIVVPCFNEQEGIENLRAKLQEWSDRSTYRLEWECILIDDGSTDGTVEAARKVLRNDARFRLEMHPSNRGLIAALLTGFEASRGQYIVCLDADCTYDPRIIDALWTKCLEGYDVVTASPYHAEGGVENVAAWRIALSRLASRMYGRLMRSKLTCYTCCVRIYNADLIKNRSQLASPGFVGVTELLWQLDYRRARIGEVPAVLRPRTTGVSKMRTLRTTYQHLKLMSKILCNRRSLASTFDRSRRNSDR